MSARWRYSGGTPNGNFARRFGSIDGESDQALTSRTRREAANAQHQKKRDRLILRAVQFNVGMITLACVVIVLFPRTSSENSTWATAMLTTIGSAGVGYMTGKNSK